MIRITIACPAAHVADANCLARVLGYSAADGETYGEAIYQDAEGHAYAVASGLVSPGFVSAAQSPLVEPEWGADMDAAARAQALIHVWQPGDPEPIARPDRLAAIIGLDTPEALALLGVSRA